MSYLSDKRQELKILGGAAVAIAAVAVVSSLSSGRHDDAPLRVPEGNLTVQAAECGVGDAVSDEGRTLVLDTQGRTDTSGESVGAVACVLDKLGATQAVRDHITSTRALDGQQTDEWGAYAARWSYHPDTGLHLTVTGG